jgi:hypothetical protein
MQISEMTASGMELPTKKTLLREMPAIRPYADSFSKSSDSNAL